ncbi:hypothetical protein [Humidesulfovibrio idahonensis]
MAKRPALPSGILSTGPARIHRSSRFGLPTGGTGLSRRPATSAPPRSD